MQSITGKVRDIDYLQVQGWCQIIIDDFVGYVREPRLLALLEAAMKNGSPVTASHDDAHPAHITRVALKPLPTTSPPHAGLHYVVALDIDSCQDKCHAAVLGADATQTDVFTCDASMESILVTALGEHWAIDYFTFDAASKEITRGKFNIETNGA